MPSRLLLVLALAAFGWTAHAATPLLPPPHPATAAPALTPAQAQQALDMLQDPAKRTQLLEVLQTVAHAAPSTAAGAPRRGPGGAAPAGAATPTLAGEVVDALATEASTASKQVSATVTAVAQFPLLYDWLVNTMRNPAARAMVFDATWRMLVVLGCGVSADLLAHFAMRRPRRSLAAVAAARMSPRAAVAEARGEVDPIVPRHVRTVALLQRLPLALGSFLLDLLGPVTFVLVTYVALGILATNVDVRQIIIVILNAYLLARVTVCATRLLVAPSAPPLRLLRLSDAGAAQTMKWTRALVATVTFGPGLVTTSEMLGLYQDAADAMLKLVGLVFSLLLIGLVLRVRAAGSALIRGLGQPAADSSLFAPIRRRFARFWHVWAILLIATLWVVWAFQVHDGLTRVLQTFLTTALVIVVARVVAIALFGLADRAFRLDPHLARRYPGLERRTRRYAPFTRRVIGVGVVVASLVLLLELWGFNLLSWFDGGVGSRLLSALCWIGFVALFTLLVWEGANALLESQVAHLVAQSQLARAARLRTLAPILRTSLLVVMLVMLLLTVLSELGVNPAPLLAGASIFGVALGFGSQKLVQDFITGLFLLLENAMQVGDFVTVSGLSGSVENLSIRTIRLRAGDGSVHIIPFSSVTSVTNVNRGMGNAVIGVVVAAAEDTDHVATVLKEIGAELRSDNTYSPMILADLELWGIDKVDGSGTTISGQISCTDTGRWGVQREFNRRMKRRLQREGIELAVPVQTVVMQRQRDVPVPPSSPEGAASAPAAAEALSPPL